MKKVFFAILVLSVCLESKANVVVGAAAVTTNIGTIDPSRPNDYGASHLIDQSGLSVGYMSGLTDFDAYIEQLPTNENTSSSTFAGFLGSTQGSFTFDLGGPFVLSKFALWNRGPYQQGVRNFSLYGSADGLSFGLLGSYTAAEGIGFANRPASAQIFDFVDAHLSFVRMDVLSIYGTCCVSMSEVAFSAVPSISDPVAVPEPSSLFLAGIGLVAVWRSRRPEVIKFKPFSASKSDHT